MMAMGFIPHRKDTSGMQSMSKLSSEVYLRDQIGILARIWCGDTGRHEPHMWGKWDQHLCDGKRAFTFMPHGRP